MWTRRVLFATMVAAAALTLARNLPASGGSSSFPTHALLMSAER
jgi:hypothetical protein